MNRIMIMMFSLLFVTKTLSACDWSVTVLEQENEIVSINLGSVVPEKTPFTIPGIASCKVCNDGKIYTVCTYDESKNSVVVMPLDDKALGQMSNMMIFDGNIEESSKQYLVITMCSKNLLDRL